MHRREYDPLYFGSSRLARFDAPAGEYGILYLGCDWHCAFIETFGQATGVRVVTLKALADRRLSTVAASRPLRLVDLTGPGLARLGADERLCAGDYAVAQRWSAALWAHPGRPDGLYYRARHDPSRYCVAVYDRVQGAIAATSAGSLMDEGHSALLADILDTYGFGLIG